MIPLPPISTLFPYTTLFRSTVTYDVLGTYEIEFKEHTINMQKPWKRIHMVDAIKAETNINFFDRSEEHTSELQSRPHLVCRLLLEKKKKKKKTIHTSIIT